MKRKILCFIMAITIVFCLIVPAQGVSVKEIDLQLPCKSAVLMDAGTGTILYQSNAHEKLPPASVTKIMTLLLIFEAIDEGKLQYDQILTVSEHASSMGGSQIFLEPNEQMSVDDLLKSVVIASANDAALTLAENVAGSEELFVSRMNERAKELGMNDTTFENVTGLDDDTNTHLTSAYDIALMSRELLKHEKIHDYTTVWMDTVRNGEFTLTNTNRLIRFYQGITGLKTGSTDKAGFCISATAKRENMHLIAVIMGAESSQIRNVCASKLLDYGFSAYSVYQVEKTEQKELKVLGGVKDTLQTESYEVSYLLEKGNEKKVTKEIVMEDSIGAPIVKGDVVGKEIYKVDGEIIGENSILAKESIEKIDYFEYLLRFFKKMIIS